MAYAACVDNRRSDVVDELFLDELVAVVDAVEHLADGERNRRVLPDDAEALLQFRRNRILQPEQTVRLETLAELRRFDWRESMMCVVEQQRFGTEL